MASRFSAYAEVVARPVDDGRGAPWFSPAVDIFEDDDAVLVRVELAGVRPEDVQIDAADGVLCICGQRRLENASRPDGYRRMERAHGAFARSFQLPADVDGANAAAVMSDGVLTVRIPKRAPAAGAVLRAS